MTSHYRHSLSVLTVATALCAGLYAVGSYLTAYIPSPWGFGQFRPAVVIPALFATIFGPMPAGIGAALGTLINDSVKHMTLYPGSLIAAVPGNFIGFYLFGYIVKKKFSWKRFILASNVTLTLANLIVAFLYVFFFKTVFLGDLEFQLANLTFLSIGLTIYWFVTMLPFVLVITPPLIRAVVVSFPSIVPSQVRTHTLEEELPTTTFKLAMLIPGLAMLVIGLVTAFPSIGGYFFANLGGVTRILIPAMFYVSGAALSLLSVLLFTKSVDGSKTHGHQKS
ncbi:MAG: ECF transporter S component [Thermoproteota archaeon]